jgi:hypothetical protein
MTNLAGLRDRVETVLMDAGNEIWDTGTLDEAIRQALAQYSLVRPVEAETTITLEAAGREIDLSSITGLLGVFDAWWPYDDSTEQWPPNRLRGWRLNWNGGKATLFLDLRDGRQPQAGEKVRVWYTAAHTIEDLDGATETTLPPEHASLIVTGAAGQAGMSRVADLIETQDVDMYSVSLLGTWSRSKQREFGAELDQIRRRAARAGTSFGQGWKLDRWDGEA